MLKYILKDIHGKETSLKNPLKVSFVSSYDAPADRLTAVFAVSENIQPLMSVEVLDRTERIFFGYVDTQTDEQTINGMILTISARSQACILLDNEALPQTYCMVSMLDLMERHFSPLGFTHFKGTSKTFDDEFVISKGMSEWAVLSEFCKKFTGTSPKIDCNGIIDISGENDGKAVYISSDRCISKKHTLKRHLLISEIMVRAETASGYIMPFKDDFADSLGIKKRRYLNAVDSKNLSPLSAGKILENADNHYEQITLNVSECVLCTVGTELIVDNEDKKYIIKEIQYSLSDSGEHTRIYAEVKYI